MTNGSTMRRRHVTVLLLVMLCAWLTWRCSHLSLPPIARDLPAEFAKGQVVFRKRLAERYPLGSEEGFIRQDLRLQGFKVGARRGERGERLGWATTARFIGCGSAEWTIRWKADRNGRLTEVLGIYGATCL